MPNETAGHASVEQAHRPTVQREPESKQSGADGNKPIWAVDLDGLEDVVYTNSILMDEKFGKAQALMVSIDMGLKAVTDIWSTDKKAIKQDVYFKLIDDPSFFDSEGNLVFTITFSSKALDNGRYVGRYKKGDANVRLQYPNSQILPALQQIDFSITTNKDLDAGNVSVIFINKESSDKSSTLDYSNTLYHELKAHVVGNIDLPADSPDRSGDKDHEEYHGTKGRYSPKPGDEKKGSIMNRFLKQARKSFFNPDKENNIYKPEPPKSN